MKREVMGWPVCLSFFDFLLCFLSFLSADFLFFLSFCSVFPPLLLLSNLPSLSVSFFILFLLLVPSPSFPISLCRQERHKAPPPPPWQPPHRRLYPGNRPSSGPPTSDPITAAQPSRVPQSSALCLFPWPGGQAVKSAVSKTGSLSLCPEKRAEGGNMEMKKIRTEERSEGYQKTEEKRSNWDKGRELEWRRKTAFILVMDNKK